MEIEKINLENKKKIDKLKCLKLITLNVINVNVIVKIINIYL